MTAVDDGLGGAPDTDDPPRPSAAWSPSGGLVGLAWAGTAGAAAWFALVVTTGDRTGLLLAAVAALGLGLAALFGTRARPRLQVDASGVTVRGLTGPHHHPWPEIGDVRVLAVRRLGRRSMMLEIDVVGPDGDERLLVFGRLDLDDDPEDVAEAVLAVRKETTG